MSTWKVTPEYKKSVIERQYMFKGDNHIVVETGWRWGEFLVHTDDDTPPKLQSGVNIYNCDYTSELVETTDGCWEDIEYDCDEETQEWVENFFEEGGAYYELEEHGWVFGDCEMIIDCGMIIEKVED